MVARTRLYTAEDLAQMPGDEPWELWYGELRKVPGASGKASALAGFVGVRISVFDELRNSGIVTFADGAYVLQRDPDVVLVPDVAFINWVNVSGNEPPDGFIPGRPDLAVEMKSPTDRRRDINAKMQLYRAAGVPLVWWIFPVERFVEVYRNGVLVATLTDGDSLDGEDILPGFKLPVTDIFERYTRTR